MYVIVNRELRQIVQEFETREEADAPPAGRDLNGH
jgi:hypothetical protein